MIQNIQPAIEDLLDLRLDREEIEIVYDCQETIANGRTLTGTQERDLRDIFNSHDIR